MKTIELKEPAIIAAYKKGDAETKQTLEILCGNQVNFNLFIIDRTPTVEDALAIAGKSLATLIHPSDSKGAAAFKVIEAVIEVLDEGEIKDYSNKQQYKYEPYFIYKPGVGLAYFSFVRQYTYSDCGSRLAYTSYEKMMHGIKILEKYYSDLNNK